MTDQTLRNLDQHTFWNSDPGQTWAQLQPLLDRQHAEATRLLLDRAALRAGESVLDIGCGGGETTFAAARAVGPAGRVVGLDISEPILDVAQRRAAGEDAPQVSFTLADAQDYVSDTPFDVAMSRFGVMFFEAPVAGFSNIAAQVRPGGRICWICWGGPAGNTLLRTSMEVSAAAFGPGTRPDPTAPGPMALQDIDRVTGLLEKAGFADIAGERISGHLTLPEEAALPLVTRLGPIAARCREEGADEALRMELGAAALQSFAPHLRNGIYNLPSEYVVYTARRS